MKQRLLLLLGVCLIVGGFFYWDVGHYLTLDQVKAQSHLWQQWLAQNPWLVASGFFAIYVVVTALSLPGAAVMTLAAGALFGLVWGTVLVSFASSLGATLAFLVSRYLLRDRLQKRFAQRLKIIDKGVQREGAFYLFTLRMVPIFPFFIINLLMGLTAMKTITFYWVSQLGMLLGTLVYVNAGTQLAQIDDPSSILSPSLLLSFALLGLLPLITKKIVGLWQRRRVYDGWDKPKQFDRNLIVIGAGAAGLVSAYIGAAVKAKVTLIESQRMGGDCLNEGCVPSKALIKTAKQSWQMRQGAQYGLPAVEVQPDLPTVMARIRQVIDTIAPHDSVERYQSLGVEVLHGHARLVDPWTVEITHGDQQQRLSARKIIIAAGAEPFVPPLPGLDQVNCLTSANLWSTLSQRQQWPKRFVVLGGGPIGCELAQAFARLGCQVTQIEMAHRLLAREDEEIADLARDALQRSGVKILTNHKALRCLNDAQGKQLVVEHNGQQTNIGFDDLLCAVGRVARLQGYGLEELGIPCQRTIEVNRFMQTRLPHIYAAGDVAGPYQFTHAAAHQAWHAAVNALFGRFKKFAIDYRCMPWVTFIDPEVARVGLNETEAKQQNIDVDVTRYPLDDLDRAICESETQGFIKVLTVPKKDRIVGVTIVGHHAGELLAEFLLAMRHNLGLNKILATIHPYPTWAEGNKMLAGRWKQSQTAPWLLKLLNRYHRWSL